MMLNDGFVRSLVNSLQTALYFHGFQRTFRFWGPVVFMDFVAGWDDTGRSNIAEHSLPGPFYRYIHTHRQVTSDLEQVIRYAQ